MPFTIVRALIIRQVEYGLTVLHPPTTRGNYFLVPPNKRSCKNLVSLRRVRDIRVVAAGYASDLSSGMLTKIETTPAGPSYARHSDISAV